MDKLKIAIDIGPLKSGDSIRGIGVYTRELLRAMNLDGVDVFNSDLGKYDIVHFTRFNPFKISVPFNKPLHTKYILTIYDLIPLIYPRHYPPGIRGMVSWQINKYLIKKNIDEIVTISETSKKDICRFLGVNPSKVHVVYLSARSMFRKMEFTEKWRESWVLESGGKRVPKKFALYVGDINYNKNIPTLVKACKIAGIPLVIAGKQAAQIEKLDLHHPELSHLRGVDWSNVIRVGFVPDDILVELYNLATVYIQPSFYEGFGLPILEANAAGVPVIAAKTQALVEIADDSALFADPKGVEDFTEKIMMIIKDEVLRNSLIRSGLENSRRFSWEKTAKETSSVYAEI